MAALQYSTSLIRIDDKDMINDELTVTSALDIREALREGVDQIEKLRIFIYGKEDSDEAIQLLPNFRNVTTTRILLQPSCKKLEFDFFPKLTELSIQTSPTLSIPTSIASRIKNLGISGHHISNTLSEFESLEVLFIDRYRGTTVSDLNLPQTLRSLTINNTRITSLDGLDNLTLLRDCRLRRVSYLVNIEALGNMLNLRRLQLTGCPKVTSLSPLCAASNLESLFICDCKSLLSVECLRSLPNLRSLALIGETNVADGNIRFLLSMPQLKTLHIRNRRNFDLRREEIPDSFSGDLDVIGSQSYAFKSMQSVARLKN